MARQTLMYVCMAALASVLLSLPVHAVRAPLQPTSQGACQGFARQCTMLSQSFQCTSQRGCRWDYSNDRCNGVANSCSFMTSRFSCDQQQGCRWTEATCRGTPDSCRHRSSFTCNNGCRWNTLDRECTGFPQSCSFLNNEFRCEQHGCRWEAR